MIVFTQRKRHKRTNTTGEPDALKVQGYTELVELRDAITEHLETEAP